MIEKLDLLTTLWLKWLMVPSFLFGIFGIIVRILSNTEYIQFIKNKKKVGMILIGQSIFVYAIGFILLAFFKHEAQKELVIFLNQTNLELKINGKEINPEESSLIYSELKNMRSLPGNHSYPKKEIGFEIISKTDTMTLQIWRDSKITSSYWVYSDKYIQTKNNGLGQLNTSLFKKY